MYDRCMAVKTTIIDTDTYELLTRAKQPGHSFSPVIKQYFGPRKIAAALLRALPSLALKEEPLDQIETQVKER